MVESTMRSVESKSPHNEIFNDKVNPVTEKSKIDSLTFLLVPDVEPITGNLNAKQK